MIALGVGLDTGIGLMIYALAGILAGLVIAVLNGVVRLVRDLMDRQQRSF